MSRHRFGTDSDEDDAREDAHAEQTRVLAEETDDLHTLARRAADHLQAAAIAADEVPRRAAEEAVTQAIVAAVDIAKRGYRRTLYGVIVVGLALITIGGIVGYTYFSNVSSQVAELTAGSAFDSNIDSTRQSNLITARRHLTEVNQARRAAGLLSVPDPGLNASSGEVDAAWTLGLSDLLTIGTLQERGLAVPGVNAPRPNSGTFPFPRASR